VLVREVVEWLAPGPDGLYVDCTLGLGGHTRALFEAGAARVVGLDRDERAIAVATARVDREGFRAVHADYRDLGAVLDGLGIGKVSGMVVDLGVSSLQLEDPARGFSFRHAGPLDMRMDQSSGPTLGDALADVDVETLTGVIREFGEERHAGRVARAIVRARERGTLLTTGDLAGVARAGAGGRGWERIDPATRTFQALRIWTNRELEGLDAFLEAAIERLAPGGRLAVIAFHSLEDRIVKHTFRRVTTGEVGARLLTRRPVVPGDLERARNPRSRSARLRVVEKAA
jgi:16S rRNA (cytosine1402-N4)-methyltransferase